jgi:hypothetical protein
MNYYYNNFMDSKMRTFISRKFYREYITNNLELLTSEALAATREQVEY